MNKSNLSDDELPNEQIEKPKQNWFKSLLANRNDTTLRETIEDFIEESAENEAHEHEQVLISNILKLNDMTVTDVMVPRADIIAIDINCDSKEILKILSENQYSRVPVYKEKLDDIIGSIHIKDVLSELTKNKKLDINKLIKDIPIVSPAMEALDLLLTMQHSKKHMALVVDEHGGIDGLITVGDIIEAIVGNIDDEYDQTEQPTIRETKDGNSYIAHARLDIESFEEFINIELSEEEKEDIDTIGGLIFWIAGRVPSRGEIIKFKEHNIVFEILESDRRKVHKVKVKKLKQN